MSPSHQEWVLPSKGFFFKDCNCLNIMKELNGFIYLTLGLIDTNAGEVAKNIRT